MTHSDVYLPAFGAFLLTSILAKPETNQALTALRSVNTREDTPTIHIRGVWSTLPPLLLIRDEPIDPPHSSRSNLKS